MNYLDQFRGIPFTFSALADQIPTYKSPEDKISKLVKSKALIRLKKGLFVVSPELSKQPISKELIANHLYGPSYISFETALSYYGLIPERVYITKSAIAKRSKIYHTPLGDFEYITVPKNYLQYGINQIVNDDKYVFLIASPEKALCDLIISKAGIRLQSVKAIRNYLINDLRIDLNVIPKWDLEIITNCQLHGLKKTELLLLKTFLENECNI